MPSTTKPELYVVDGSNIATEGRSAPSLEQLNDAVMAFLDSHPHATVTVVVDATFGHRIAKKEVAAFDEAVANNELVTPPAGAVGRGDAFVLAIADRAKAGILSNDSFQEFHGEYDWLFDEGRLIGGKPVPHVGWVFVKRSPVRGPKSRQAVREAAGDAKGAKEQANRRVRKKADGGSDAAATDDTVPAETGVDGAGVDVAGVDVAGVGEVAAGGGADRSAGASTSSSRRGRRGRGRRKPADAIGAEQQATIEAAKAVTAPREHVNDLLPFLEFVEQHPVGTSCTVVVESYSSHGAYARVDDVLVYIPLRLMDDPMPRSARSVLKVGEAVTTVIVGYVPDRRSIDAALPHMAVAVDGTPTSDDRPAEMSDTTALTSSVAEPDAAEQPAAEKAPAKRASAKRAPAKKAPAKKAPAKKAPAKRTPAKKAPAEKTAAKKVPAKAAPAKQAAAETKTTPTKTAAKKTTAKKAPAEKTAANKTAAKKTAAKNTATKQAPAKAAPGDKTPSETTATAKKSAAKKTPAKKTAAKKSAATKAPARGASARRTTATTSEPS